jgi:hypothetical protein
MWHSGLCVVLFADGCNWTLQGLRAAAATDARILAACLQKITRLKLFRTDVKLLFCICLAHPDSLNTDLPRDQTQVFMQADVLAFVLVNPTDTCYLVEHIDNGGVKGFEHFKLELCTEPHEFCNGWLDVHRKAERCGALVGVNTKKLQCQFACYFPFI